jgi:hypothetical protein
MTPMERSEKRRLHELLPWYLNGMLDEKDKEWVEQFLRDHPDTENELAWHQQLRDALDIRHMKIPANVGLHRLLEQVNAEEAKTHLGFFERVRRFFTGLNPRPALAVAAVLVVAQAITLGFLVNKVQDQDRLILGYSTTRAVAGQQDLNRPVLRITFKSGATERDIRLLLLQVQGRIIDGPTQLGDYRVELPAERLEEAKSVLQKSKIVELVLLNKTAPGDE